VVWWIWQYKACHSSVSKTAVHASAGIACASMVVKTIRHAITLNSAKQRCKRSAVSNWRISMAQPLFSALCQISMPQRQHYHATMVRA